MATKHPQLSVEKRKVFGKQLKKLRREGVLPGNVYGEGIKSTAVQVSYTDFTPLYKEVRNTGIVDLQLDGKTLPVLIHQVQKDHLRDEVLHADFFKVNLKEKIKATIPVRTVGEPQAVADKVGLLLQPLSEVEVEALPEALPEAIEVNVEGLSELGAQITVADLKTPEGAVILTDPGQVVAKIGELVTKEAEEEAAAEEAAEEAQEEEQQTAEEAGEEAKAPESTDETPQE